VIGLLLTGAAAPNAPYVAAFRKGLADAGFLEGRTVAIEYRYADSEVARLPDLAIDLVRRRVAVIATLGGVAPVRAAKAATTTIPIVFETGGDPVEAGFVASFNRPGGNVTGVSILSTAIEPKRLGLLQAMLPKARSFAALLNSTAV